MWGEGYKCGWRSRARSLASPCPELTLGGREAEHDHSGDGAVLQDRPSLQNLCVEGEDSGPSPEHPRPARPRPAPPCLGPCPSHHLDSAGLRERHGHNRSDSRELRVAGTCRAGCARQARGHWGWTGGQRGLRAVTRPQPPPPPP